MTLHAAWKMDTEGASAARQEIALIKFFGAGVMHDVVDRALQAHGSLGYSTDLPLEQMYRFARAARFYDGPDEVHRQSVARRILRGYEAPADGVPTEHVPTRREAARERFARPARGRHLQRLRVLLGVLLAALACAGCGSTGRSSSARVDRFDGTRAFAELRREVELGPRPAGSPVLRKLAVRLKHALPRGHFEAVPGHPGLRNIVGRIPGKKPAVVVAAHYDTKDLPGFVGANDGAGGTAAVLELARALRHTKRPKGAPELRFVLFDGEEATDDDRDFLATGVRGSKAYARRHADELRALVLLDFVADKDLSIPREAGSDAKLWARLRRAAKRAGVGGTFPDELRGEITDDHTPFTARGVPVDRPDRLRLPVLAQDAATT